MTTRRHALVTTAGLLTAAALAGIASPAAAQQAAWPSKPVRIVVPFTAGSATDTLARTVGQKLGEAWHQQVIIDNKPGAGGTIGAAQVAKSAPDGYTLMVHSSGHAVNASMYPSLPYDTLKDFVQVVPLAGQPNVLVTAANGPYKSVADLVAAAKKQPGGVTIGSAGVGSGTHVNGEKFKLAAGIDLLHVPYKGTPEVLTDVIAGRVACFFSPTSGALSLIRDGKLTALAVSSQRRSSVLPQVPSVAESGVPGFDYNLWVAVFAPAGTPPEVIDKINRDVNAALATQEVKDRLTSLGAEAMPMSPAEFDRFFRTEMEDGARIVKAGNIKAQ